MKENFKTFASNIQLTKAQRDDAKTKYQNVCKTLYKKYYTGNYDSHKQFLFGSYKTKTNIRPIDEMQDVDVLFKIPKATFEKFDNYESNGQSALLQEIKDTLKQTYTTTDTIKGWGKVVLVKFSENKHNVELLPAYEQEDGTFLIPNAENGGSWDTFDPRAEVKKFQESNSGTEDTEGTNGFTAELSRMIKCWIRNTSTLTYKSFMVVNDIIEFLENNYTEGASHDEYPNVLKDFFDFLDKKYDDDKTSHIETVLNRANNAITHMDNNKPKDASEEWRKIFGDKFPLTKENPKSKTRTFSNATAPYSKANAEKKSLQNRKLNF